MWRWLICKRLAGKQLNMEEGRARLMFDAHDFPCAAAGLKSLGRAVRVPLGYAPVGCVMD